MAWASFALTVPVCALQICAYPMSVDPLPAAPIGGRTSAPDCSSVCEVQDWNDLADYF
jgi:hypothetical protein